MLGCIGVVVLLCMWPVGWLILVAILIMEAGRREQ